jgi:hypothetical protein
LRGAINTKSARKRKKTPSGANALLGKALYIVKLMIVAVIGSNCDLRLIPGY